MTNFNKLGKEYLYVAFAPPETGYGVLREKALNFLKLLEQEINFRATGKSLDLTLVGLSKVLSRLRAVLYCSSRVRFFANEIEHIVPESGMVVRNHKELGFEFESLIFHAVATLDSLAALLSKICVDCKLFDKNGNTVQIYFSNLKKALQNSQASDVRAQYLFQLITECESGLSDTVLSVGRKTLRNQLAHQNPIPDLSGSNFIIYRLDDNRLLRFDQDVYGLPLLATARNITWIVTYVVLKSVAIILTKTAQGALVGHLNKEWQVGKVFFEPQWEIGFVGWKDFISKDGKGSTFSVSKCEASGFRIVNHVLNKSVLDHAVEISFRA